SVQDPSAKLTRELLTTALAGFTVPAACATADRTVVAWVVFEHGRVVTATVTTGALEACVADALRKLKLEIGASRVGAVVAVTVTKASPPPAPRVAVFVDRNRKILDDILEKHAGTNLGKFTGIMGDNKVLVLGTGCGGAAGRGGGGTAEGDFV